ncbi:MAG TPA: hypothetical protein VGM31_20830, partial [Puia sp.]
MKRYFLWLVGLLIGGAMSAQTVYSYGSEQNDLLRLLRREGMTVRVYDSPQAAVNAAGSGSAVFLLAHDYPNIDPKNTITPALLDA